MTKEKKAIIIAVVIVAAIVIISLARWALVVAPQDQKENLADVEQVQVEEEIIEDDTLVEETPNKGDYSAYSSEMREFALYLAKYNWINTKGYKTLTFGANELTLKEDGESGHTMSFDPQAYLSMREDGPLGGADVEVMSAQIDGKPSIIYFRLKDLTGVVFSNIPNIIYDGSGLHRVYCITISSLNETFVPFEKTQIEVETSSVGKKLLGDDLARAEASLKDYVAKNYPTANYISWSNIATIDYRNGVYALFYKLNDSNLSTITLLYRDSSRNIQIHDGEVTEYDSRAGDYQLEDTSWATESTQPSSELSEGEVE